MRSHCCIDQCRIAIMSYGEGSSRADKPLFGASWNQILVQLETLKQCIRPAEGGPAAGGWTPFTCKSGFGLASDNSLFR